MKNICWFLVNILCPNHHLILRQMLFPIVAWYSYEHDHRADKPIYSIKTMLYSVNKTYKFYFTFVWPRHFILHQLRGQTNAGLLLGQRRRRWSNNTRNCFNVSWLLSARRATLEMLFLWVTNLSVPKGLIEIIEWLTNNANKNCR